MRLWIVGGNGLLGSSLQACCRLWGIDYIATGRAEADITDREALLQKARQSHPSHLINCAAFTDVDGAEKNFQEAFRINAEGAENVALTARECGIPLVQVSTDYVFDGEKKTPYLETDSCAPLNVYGRSKWEGEQRVLGVLPTACILRTSWLFGAQGKNFLSSLWRWMGEKEEITVVSDQYSCPTYCVDLAEAIVALCNHSGIFHFANEGVASRYEVASVVFALAKQRGIPMCCQNVKAVSRDNFPTPAKRPKFSALNTNKYIETVGKAPRSWQEAMELCVPT